MTAIPWAGRRNDEGGWLFVPYGEGAAIDLMSLGLTISMDGIYEDVILEVLEN